MDLLGLGLMSGGIKCRECNSVVPNRVGLAHLHANGINCYELYAPFLACVYVGAVLTPAMGKNNPNYIKLSNYTKMN